MNKQELIALWKNFAEKNDFMLNPDVKHVEMIAEGVLANESASGFKLCPCRIGDGSKERTLQLLCPCNFKTHETWVSKNRCWCGLFVRR
jgi:ferredoxin-thioredoxin reductase catalytic subunit